MAGRSPARFLAPIALVAFAFALYSVVQDGRDAGGRQLRHDGTAHRDGDRDQHAKKKKSVAKKKTQDVHGQVRRHAVRRSPRRPASSLETLQAAQPRPRPADALAGPEDQAERVKRRAGIGAALLLALALPTPASAQPPSAPDCPDTRRARRARS